MKVNSDIRDSSNRDSSAYDGFMSPYQSRPSRLFVIDM